MSDDIQSAIAKHFTDNFNLSLREMLIEHCKEYLRCYGPLNLILHGDITLESVNNLRKRLKSSKSELVSDEN